MMNSSWKSEMNCVKSTNPYLDSLCGKVETITWNQASLRSTPKLGLAWIGMRQSKLQNTNIMMVGKLNYTCCSVEGCEVPGTIRNGKRWFTRGFCHIHYARFMKFGDPLHEPDYCPKGFGVGKHPLYPMWFPGHHGVLQGTRSTRIRRGLLRNRWGQVLQPRRVNTSP